nr:MAG TPA: hypothetical protein [Caudoviricetes sp.]
MICISNKIFQGIKEVFDMKISEKYAEWLLLEYVFN